MRMNMTLLTDLYQLTMVGAYHLLGKSRQKANFDYFFRKIPEEGGFCVAAGLEQLIEYIENIQPEPLPPRGADFFPEPPFYRRPPCGS
jgi:nicotinic acid phosphoribosyltransferase